METFVISVGSIAPVHVVGTGIGSRSVRKYATGRSHGVIQTSPLETVTVVDGLAWPNALVETAASKRPKHAVLYLYMSVCTAASAAVSPSRVAVAINVRAGEEIGRIDARPCHSLALPATTRPPKKRDPDHTHLPAR